MNIMKNLRDFTDEDNERLIKLINEAEYIEAFEYEGVKYLGNNVWAAKLFIHENPNRADFHVWLQNNYNSI